APTGSRESVRPSSVGQSSAGLSSAMQSSGVQGPSGHSPTGPRESTRLWLEAAFAALAVGDERLREANTYAEEAERAGEPLLAPLARALRVHIAERSGDEVLASELARAAFDPFALRGLIDNAPAPSPARDGLLPFVRREQLLALADSWEKLAQPVRGAARGPTGAER
ncbi:MAG TPA: hypothetical protein VLC09_18200, partial [Polyangiaceae bacterium]|nr:hypothetical protein [Polyangiaceae bacterium]